FGSGLETVGSSDIDVGVLCRASDATITCGVSTKLTIPRFLTAKSAAIISLDSMVLKEVWHSINAKWFFSMTLKSSRSIGFLSSDTFLPLFLARTTVTLSSRLLWTRAENAALDGGI